MIIKVNIKQLGSRRKRIAEIPFKLENTPATVRELIEGAVHTCVCDYNERVKKGENTSPLSGDAISEMSEVGKIAFGINYGCRSADENVALKNALQGYEDGLYRIFIGENEAGSLSDGISLSENDSVSFIRLTMLTGRIW